MSWHYLITGRLKKSKSGADLAAELRARVRTAFVRIMGRAAGRTPYPRVASAYEVRERGPGVWVALINKSEIFPFVEDDSRPHWPPWGPGTPLAKWANARNITPFLVARKISVYGTKGHHYFRDAWEEGEPEVIRALDGATVAVIKRWLA